jgi:hypothetical protein
MVMNNKFNEQWRIFSHKKIRLFDGINYYIQNTLNKSSCLLDRFMIILQTIYIKPN